MGITAAGVLRGGAVAAVAADAVAPAGKKVREVMESIVAPVDLVHQPADVFHHATPGDLIELLLQRITVAALLHLADFVIAVKARLDHLDRRIRADHAVAARADPHSRARLAIPRLATVTAISVGIARIILAAVALGAVAVVVDQAGGEGVEVVEALAEEVHARRLFHQRGIFALDVTGFGSVKGEGGAGSAGLLAVERAGAENAAVPPDFAVPGGAVVECGCGSRAQAGTLGRGRDVRGLGVFERVGAACPGVAAPRVSRYSVTPCELSVTRRTVLGSTGCRRAGREIVIQITLKRDSDSACAARGRRVRRRPWHSRCTEGGDLAKSGQVSRLSWNWLTRSLTRWTNSEDVIVSSGSRGLVYRSHSE